MSKNVVLGGQRLGTGNKMEVNLHNYDRANFNLDKTFRSTMSCGTLVPFYCNIGLNGDTFDINLRHLLKTLPTNGPLMGFFKLQLDMFTIPMRLYNGLLHNNMTGIGLDMKEIKIPKIRVSQNYYPLFNINEPYKQINPSSLLAYLGVRGLGSTLSVPLNSTIQREFNALPILSYIDIFKQYYSNKQEKYFYQISVTDKDVLSNVRRIGGVLLNSDEDYYYAQKGGVLSSIAITFTSKSVPSLEFVFNTEKDRDLFLSDWESNNLGFWYSANNITEKILFKSLFNDYELDTTIEIRAKYPTIRFKATNWENSPVKSYAGVEYNIQPDTLATIQAVQNIGNGMQRNITSLIPIELETLDDLRNEILSKVKGQKGVTLYVNEQNTKFKVLDNICEETGSGQLKSRYAQNGLFVKTYMSDIFNNWLNTETIEGANGISEITKVSTADGGFTIDALNLAQKVYNLLNRIAVSGGTYDDWQEVVWDVETIRKAESPIYEGGYSAIIGFDEVVQTAQSEGSDPLGSLAGKGYTYNNKGGEINIKIKEPSIIMGIASITPMLDYSQGNRWYMTDLDSFDDLHMPALDGIGFQDLLTEKLCATDTYLEHKGSGYYDKANEQNAIGKQPAWINWQTDINETFGDFAIPSKMMYMTINRNYDTDEYGNIEDVTTYIDPKKYNYAFADTALEAQNFQVQIAVDCKARRKMSAKIIPTM